MNASDVISDVVSGVLVGAGFFGIGCVAGVIAGSNILHTGALYGITGVVALALKNLITSQAQKRQWKHSTTEIVRASAGLLLCSAMATAGAVVGIFGPLGIGIILGLGVAQCAYRIGSAIYIRHKGKDRIFSASV